MTTSLDMSLDDLIKNRNGSGRGRGRGQGRGRGWGHGRGGNFRGRGMGRQGPLSVNARASSYKIAKSFNRVKDAIWQHDLFDDSMMAVGYPRVEPGTKLYISNLDYRVSNEDIKELFSEVGELKKCTVHYDRNGHPSGTAEAVYVRRSDAMAALKRYNNVHLDGKPMKIEEIGSNVSLPTTRVNVVGGPAGGGRRTVVMTTGVGRGGSSSFGRGGSRGRPTVSNHRGFQQGKGRGGSHGRGGRGRGRGRGHGKKLEKSAEELDKELENYHVDAMNTS